MKIHRQGPARPASQTWHIAVGEHAGHLEHPEALALQVHVLQSGPDAGKVELDIRETSERRIVMGETEAEALAHVFSRMQGEDGERIAHALLDAAHLARLARGDDSVPLPIGELRARDRARQAELRHAARG